jgi:hypothetical protein
MVPPDRVGQLWTRGISAARSATWLDLGAFHLVSLRESDWKVKEKSSVLVRQGG